MSDIKEEQVKRYKTSCPHCGKDIYPTRSLGMLMFGMAEGYGGCPHCKNTVMLKWDKITDTLTACRDEISDKINARRAEKMS